MKHYSIAEVAKILKKSYQWIWVLVISGRLQAEKVGKTFIISDESLRNYKINNNHKDIKLNEGEK